MKLLHIIATPRENRSNTLQVTNPFLKSMKAKYPDLIVDEVDLYTHDLPAVIGQNIESKYTLLIGQPITKDHAEAWDQVERLIQQFLSSDIYLISVPMWNFSIPYALKYYIDSIVQPGYVYKYNEFGQPVPLVLGKKMICITSRGGDYSPNGPFYAYDFQEPYLRAIFGFIGIADICFVNAQPMDVSLAVREAALATAIAEATEMAANTDWNFSNAAPVVAHPQELKPSPLKTRKK